MRFPCRGLTKSELERIVKARWKGPDEAWNISQVIGEAETDESKTAWILIGANSS